MREIIPRNKVWRDRFKLAIERTLLKEQKAEVRTPLYKIAKRFRVGYDKFLSIVYELEQAGRLPRTDGVRSREPRFNESKLEARIEAIRTVKRELGPKFWRGHMTIPEEILERILP